MNFIKVYKVINDNNKMFMIKRINYRYHKCLQFKFLQFSPFTSTVVTIRMKMKTVHVIAALLMMSCIVGMSEGGRKVQKRK